MVLSPIWRWTLGATATMAVAMGISRFAYTPLLPAMQSSFGWSINQAGDLASLNYFGYLLGALIAPRLLRGDTAAQDRVLALALMGCVLTSALGAFASSFGTWGALRFGAGVASAVCLIQVTSRLAALLRESEPGATRQPAHLHFSGVGIGIVLSVLLVRSESTASVEGVAEAWALLGGASAMILLLAWALFRSVADSDARGQSAEAANTASVLPEAPTDSGRLPRTPWSPVNRIVLGYGLFGFAYIITATFIVAMSQDSVSSAAAAQDIWLIAGLALVPSVPLWLWIAQRVGAVVTLGAAYLVEAVAVLLAAFGSGTLALGIAAALLGGTFAAITALGLALATALRPGAATVGIMTAMFALGQLLGPSVAARLATFDGGFALPSVVAAIALALAALLLIRVRPPIAGQS